MNSLLTLYLRILFGRIRLFIVHMYYRLISPFEKVLRVSFRLYMYM